MYYLFFLAKVYPVFALSCAFVIAELGLYFHRKKGRTRYYCWGISFLLVASAVCWFVFRGDLNSDQWIGRLIGKA